MRFVPAGHFALKPGTEVQVKPYANGYPLSPGFEPGVVKLLSFDTGYYEVEKAGLRFKVFLANVVEPVQKKSSGTANRRHAGPQV